MVRVAVPSMLAAQAEGRKGFDVEAETVGEALHALPVADLLFNERGALQSAPERVPRRDGRARARRSRHARSAAPARSGSSPWSPAASARAGLPRGATA